MAPITRKEFRKKLDLSPLVGLLIALGGILGGLLLEGGRISDVSQFTAALIVLGGTTGAVLVTTPLPLFLSAVKKLPALFWEGPEPVESTVFKLLSFASHARRHGLVSLDPTLKEIDDPFLQKALMLVVDGTDLQVVRNIMDLEIEAAELAGESETKVFESAGGYAPTVGIIGAVLGLIQVMKHLEDIEAVGHGIAVSFVATVYGVAAANILFLPIAKRLKHRLEQSIQFKTMMLEGVIAIAEGLHPTLIKAKLEPFEQRSKKKADQSVDDETVSAAA
jgi:chemotaxis protein MotA